MKPSVNTILAMMPIESRVRFEKMVAASKKPASEIAVSLLSEGANTYAPMLIAMHKRRERLAK